MACHSLLRVTLCKGHPSKKHIQAAGILGAPPKSPVEPQTSHKESPLSAEGTGCLFPKSPFLRSPGWRINCWSQLPRNLPHEIWIQSPEKKSRQRRKKEAVSRIGRRQVYSERELTSKACLGTARQVSEPSGQRLLSIFRGFSGVQSRPPSGRTHNTLVFDDCLLKNGSHCGNGGQMVNFKDGE